MTRLTALLSAGLLLIVAITMTLLSPSAGHPLRGRLAPILALTACALGGVAATAVILTTGSVDLSLPWDVPGGSLTLHVDSLSALFLLPVFVLGGLGIAYGREYWEQADGAQPRGAWAWYYLFILSMALVTLAANAVLFLVVWESMSVTAFFLVTHEDERAEVREAGWTFLIAAHLGTAFLLAMFAILGRGLETLDFTALAAAGASADAVVVGLVFLLALAGFGTKAGLVPAHVWLPAAHPAAPSHVSAVLSGAMLNMGIYGLLRTVTLLPTVPPWGGWLLIGVGIGSGVFGIVFALAQRDLKRLLADSSIENLGVITAGMGVGLVGVQHGSSLIAGLGFAGALLHALNHALFKGLLFLVAGSVLHATGSRNLDELGGLLRRMPWTGTLFFVGAAAIVGLPPLNGFVSEFLLYLAAFEGLRSGDAGVAVAMLGVVFGLTLIGGLAAATFLRASLAFSGSARSQRAEQAHDPGLRMRLPMAILGAGCLAIGALSFAVVPVLDPVVQQLGGASPVAAGNDPALQTTLRRAAFGGWAMVILATALWWLRSRLLARRRVTRGPVWATAYLAPQARQQYSGASFVDPLASAFAPVLRSERRGGAPGSYFPSEAALSHETPGLFRERVFVPAFRGVTWAALQLRWLQHGRVQLYLMAIPVTLIILLVWKLGEVP